jgi:hypothetical protein
MGHRKFTVQRFVVLEAWWMKRFQVVLQLCPGVKAMLAREDELCVRQLGRFGSRT